MAWITCSLLGKLLSCSFGSRSRRNTSEMKEAFDESPAEERCGAAVLGRDSRRRQRGGRGRGTRQQQEDGAELQQEGRISVVQTGWWRGSCLRHCTVQRSVPVICRARGDPRRR